MAPTPPLGLPVEVTVPPAPLETDPEPPESRGLSLSAQKELAQVLSDEFCYCGCPHTLGACLREHACPHAQRMARLAASEAKEGFPATEIILNLSRYYQSFSEPRAPFTPDARLCHGNAIARITLVEFSDFECPYCAAVAPVLKEVVKARPDVRVCYRPFPLPMHPHAKAAAAAALFAARQGKFWPFHDQVFENQQRLDIKTLRQIALSLQLDAQAMEKAIDQGTFDDVLEAAKQEGTLAQVRSTPSIFINGRKMTLGFSLEYLVHAIDDEAEWMANGQSWAPDDKAER